MHTLRGGRQIGEVIGSAATFVDNVHGQFGQTRYEIIAHFPKGQAPAVKFNDIHLKGGK